MGVLNAWKSSRKMHCVGVRDPLFNVENGLCVLSSSFSTEWIKFFSQLSLIIGIVNQMNALWLSTVWS